MTLGLLDSPKAGDPVVAHGTKYRIREIATIQRRGRGRGYQRAELVDAGPHWRTNPWRMSIELGRLEYDAVAGVWRPRP